MNTEKLKQSEPERMLIKATQDFNSIINAIFGAECNVRLEVSGAPVSKVAIINETNAKAASAPHKSCIAVSESALAIVHDVSYMPF